MALNISVIGCGRWGRNFVRNFRQMSDVSQVVACDINEQILKEIGALYSDVKQNTRYEDIVQSDSVDAVCVATPPSTHFEISKAALLNGKHVLVEKPMTLSSGEAKELLVLAERNERVLMISHTCEYNSAVRKLKEYVQRGDLGKILYVDMVRTNSGVFRDDVNVLWDLCPHDFSILNYVLQQYPSDIQAVGGAHKVKGVQDIAFLTVNYPNGILARIRVSWIDPAKVRKITFVGDKKMAVFDDLHDEEPIKIYDTSSDDVRYDTYESFKHLHDREGGYALQIDTAEPLKVECSHFVDCVTNSLRPSSDGESGLRVVEMLQAAQESLNTDGKRVRVKIN